MNEAKETKVSVSLHKSFSITLALFTLCSLLSGCGVTQTAVGTTGAAGPAGPPGLIFTGAYKGDTPYVATDVVTYQGSSYVALASSTNVAPVGNVASGKNWAVLAQAGATGPEGPMGVQGLIGPAGAIGVQGPMGPGGATGKAGAVGATGPQGPVGAMGPPGPAGPSGATGSQGTGGQNSTSVLNGRRLGVQGDSIAAWYNNAWQNVVIARTGMTLVNQDARAGRRFDSAFECYGTNTPGSSLGTYRTVGLQGFCFASGGAEGATLAQNMADVDIEVIALGTNDRGSPLGNLGDATNSGTFYGNMRWVVETYLTAKPALRVVLVTVQYNGFFTAAEAQQYANATVIYGNSIGVPVINMFKLGGVNAITAGVLLQDGVHPSDYGFANNYGPVIAQALQQLY